MIFDSTVPFHQYKTLSVNIHKIRDWLISRLIDAGVLFASNTSTDWVSLRSGVIITYSKLPSHSIKITLLWCQGKKLLLNSNHWQFDCHWSFHFYLMLLNLSYHSQICHYLGEHSKIHHFALIHKPKTQNSRDEIEQQSKDIYLNTSLVFSRLYLMKYTKSCAIFMQFHPIITYLTCLQKIGKSITWWSFLQMYSDSYVCIIDKHVYRETGIIIIRNLM